MSTSETESYQISSTNNCEAARINKLEAGNHSFQRGHDFAIPMRSRKGGLMRNVISSGLVETASSIAVAATVVGAAATLLVKRTKASEATQVCFACSLEFCIVFDIDDYQHRFCIMSC